MTKKVYMIPAATAAVTLAAALWFVLVISNGSAAVAVAPNPSPVSTASTNVADWNDGYATAMRDLCEDSHDKYACEWGADNGQTWGHR